MSKPMSGTVWKWPLPELSFARTFWKRRIEWETGASFFSSETLLFPFAVSNRSLNDLKVSRWRRRQVIIPSPLTHLRVVIYNCISKKTIITMHILLIQIFFSKSRTPTYPRLMDSKRGHFYTKMYYRWCAALGKCVTIWTKSQHMVQKRHVFKGK